MEELSKNLMSDIIYLLRRSDIRRLKATNISFSISESISPSFLETKMNTPSFLSKFASFLLSYIYHKYISAPPLLMKK
jgi:hypothetical protein